MKKISQLVVGLLSFSCAMGMNQLTLMPKKQVPHDLYKAKFNKEIAKFTIAGGKSLISMISPLAVADFEFSCKRHKMGCDSTAIMLFQSLSFLQLTLSLCELWNAGQNPQRALSKKNRMLLATSFFGTAIPWAYVSMIDKCLPDALFCSQGRQFFCLLNLLVAGLSLCEIQYGM